MNKLAEEFQKETGIHVGGPFIQTEYVRWLEGKLQNQKWVKCSDKLPDKPGHYLVYAPRSFPKNCKWVVAEFYNDNNTFYSESSDEPMEDVTHWIKLPSDPR